MEQTPHACHVTHRVPSAPEPHQLAQNASQANISVEPSVLVLVHQPASLLMEFAQVHIHLPFDHVILKLIKIALITVQPARVRMFAHLACPLNSSLMAPVKPAIQTATPVQAALLTV